MNEHGRTRAMATLYAVTRPGPAVAGPKEGERGPRCDVAGQSEPEERSSVRERAKDPRGRERNWTEREAYVDM